MAKSRQISIAETGSINVVTQSVLEGQDLGTQVGQLFRGLIATRAVTNFVRVIVGPDIRAIHSVSVVGRADLVPCQPVKVETLCSGSSTPPRTSQRGSTKR